MNWYRHPQTVEALAANYVLGSMSARSRRRLEQVMAQHPDVAHAVSYWAEHAMPVALSLPARALPEHSWERLAGRLGLQSPAAAGAPARWWRRWRLPVPAAGLAIGMAAGIVTGLFMALVVPQLLGSPTGTQLPESYVGVLATAQDKPGLIVSSLRRGTLIDLKVLAPVPVPADHYLMLWRIDRNGVPTALGRLPPTTEGRFLHMRLPSPAEEVFFAAVELAVSVERDRQPPPRTPAQPYVYRGLCGKVWK